MPSVRQALDQGVTAMPAIPSAVADFLTGKRIVVAGVSRTGRAPANAIFRRLQQCGYEAIPVNPNATQLEGRSCCFP
jgi:predicted CoA-binding protein